MTVNQRNLRAEAHFHNFLTAFSHEEVMLRLSAALCSSCSVLKYSDALASLWSVSHLYKELQISVAPVFGLCHPGTGKRAALQPLIP